MKVLTHGCTSGEIINLERNTTEAATIERQKSQTIIVQQT